MPKKLKDNAIVLRKTLNAYFPLNKKESFECIMHHIDTSETRMHLRSCGVMVDQFEKKYSNEEGLVRKLDRAIQNRVIK